MKILSWNINCRSSVRRKIPDLVIESIAAKNPDVFCLNEFVKGVNYREFIDRLSKLGYEAFVDPRTTGCSGNEILIAVKREHAVMTESFVINNDHKNPNFLHVAITRKNEEKINLIGVRIKILSPEKNLSKDEKEKFQIKEAKERMCQLNNLVSYLEKLEGQQIYAIGDWNNYYYDDNSKIDTWKSDDTYLQNYYSYPLLVSKMATLGLTNYTPQGYSWLNKSVRSKKKYIRNDHVFSNANVSDLNYCWAFTNSINYIPDEVGYPDHAMLLFTAH
ncbi:hypothetical protein BAU15_14815 [Enterococcus sp. JM4C]|uniref:endonuclease/exonuclease/phosphatase family protein n=1 Tax=Candidatus Enterococcus huntleyi TaxID=1857217 RepID=UPI00137A0CB6|nr:endonuclease/exonuclease/phosphatase family protein [Enterococcus sp. JM4C]KAF1296610.1 hypothetical protein BAU15_14815 [Enterococcus sp. JM4C]